MVSFFFFFSSRRRHTRLRTVTGVQTCALPIYFVLPPDQIARELAEIGRHPYLRAPSTLLGEAEAEMEGDFRKILPRLHVRTGVDFSDYRDTTIKRRLGRRMAKHQQASLPHYLRFMQANPEEIG